LRKKVVAGNLLPGDDGLSDVNKKGRPWGRGTAFFIVKIAPLTDKMKIYRKFLPRF